MIAGVNNIISLCESDNDVTRGNSTASLKLLLYCATQLRNIVRSSRKSVCDGDKTFTVADPLLLQVWTAHTQPNLRNDPTLSTSAALIFFKHTLTFHRILY